MTDLATSLRLLLHSSEDVKFTLEATPATTEGDGDATTLQSKRVLAVVSHKHELNTLEEGGSVIYFTVYHPIPEQKPILQRIRTQASPFTV